MTTPKKEGQKQSLALPVILVLAVAIFIGGGLYAYTNIQSQNAEEPTQEESLAQAEGAVEEQAQPEESITQNENAPETPAVEPASGQAEEQAEQSQNEFVVEPGNPVIAKLNGKDLTRVDLFRFVQQLPPQLRQQPLDQLYPLAQEQLINSQLIDQKVANVDLSGNEEVQAQVEEARKSIERTVFMQQEIEKRLTEDRVQQGYQLYVDNFPKDIRERSAKHILVESEDKAKALIEQIKGGADFATLAKENSIDQGSAINGGELNFFAENDVVPEFSEAAFGAELNSMIETPVKSQFGYHVIMVGEERMRPPVPFEQAKPSIEAELRNAILDEVLREWRGESEIERFDINGNAIEAATSGE